MRFSGCSMLKFLQIIPLKRIFIFLAVVSLFGESVSAETKSAAEILQSLQTARQEIIPNSVRSWVANQAVQYLQSRSKDTLGKNLSSQEVFQKFAENPALLDTLDWGRNKNSIETKIFTELTDYFDQAKVQKTLLACPQLKDHTRYSAEMAAGAAKYSTVCDGLYSRKIMVYTVPGKKERIDVPLFAWPAGFEDALNASATSLLAESYEPSPPNTPPWMPPLEKLREKYNGYPVEIIAALETRRDAYERTLGKNLQEKLRLQARHANSEPKKPIVILAKDLVEKDCRLCSPGQKKRLQSRLQLQAAREERAGNLNPISPKEIRHQLCHDLRNAEYPFDEVVQIEAAKAFGKPSGSFRGMKMDKAVIQAKQTKEALYEERRSILGRLSRMEGDRKLILTEEMTVLTANSPGHILLRCDIKSEANDLKIVSASIESARKKIDAFQAKLNEIAAPTSNEPQSLDAQNIELMKLSPATMGEALMQSSVDGSVYACKLAGKIGKTEQDAQSVELMKLWGVGAVSAAVPLFGLAYGSVAGLTYTALATGATLAYANDQWDQSKEAESLSAEIRRDAIGLGGDDWKLEQSQEAYAKYRELKWNAILSGAMTIPEWAGMVKGVLSSQLARNVKNATATSKIEIQASPLLKEIEETIAQKSATGAAKDVIQESAEVVRIEKVTAPQVEVIPSVPRGKKAKFKDWKAKHLQELPPETNAEFLKMSIADVQKNVNSANVLAIHKVGDIKSMTRFYVVELDNGIVGIYKPDGPFQLTTEGKRYANSGIEVAVSAVDDYYGLGLVPATVETEIFIGVSHNGMTRGSFQLFEPATQTGFEIVEAGGIISHREAFKIDLFDSLIDNTDRHLENLLVRKDGSAVAIDHSRSFAPGEKLYNSWTGFHSRKPGFSVNTRTQKLKDMKFYSVVTGEKSIAQPFSQRGMYSDADAKQFLTSEEGTRFLEKLKSTTKENIAGHLRKRAPSLSRREIAVYSTRIERRSRLLVEYADSILKK